MMMEHCDSVLQTLADLVEAAKRETRSKHAHRLVDYLLVNETALTFPRKIRYSNRCVGWRKADLDAWLEQKARQAKGGNQ